MSVPGKETVVSTFAETQLVPITVYVEMDTIFIKMEKLVWVGNAKPLHQDKKLLSLAFIIISNQLLYSKNMQIYPKICKKICKSTFPIVYLEFN